MGKVRTNAAIKGFSNNIDGFVYYERNGKACVRPYFKPSDPKTHKQQKVRNAFRTLSSLWKQLDGILVESWNALGRTTKVSGYNAFIGANANSQRAGQPLTLCPEYGMEGLTAFTARAGSAAGEIVCEYTPGETVGTPSIMFFAQKTEKGIAGGDLARFDGGPASGPSFTLTGLESGCAYHVYAILTDAPYAEATTVSVARSAICTAGV